MPSSLATSLDLAELLAERRLTVILMIAAIEAADTLNEVTVDRLRRQ